MGATGLLVILGKLFILRTEFSLLDVVLALGLIVGGAGVVFTGTVLALLKAIPFPWRKSTNGG